MRPVRSLEAAAVPAAGLSAAAFAALSALRGKRFFHPDGVSFEGTVTFHDDTPLPFSGSHGAFTRLSRGMGLPDLVPDVLGLAIKVPDLGQDLLLVTSGEDTVTRHLLIPATGFFHRPYSSILPYELDGDLILFGARADESLASLGDQQMNDLSRHVASGKVRFDLTWGKAGTNEVTAFGSLVLERPYDDELVFNPFNSQTGVCPAGALNRLRRETYRKSQEARPDSNS